MYFPYNKNHWLCFSTLVPCAISAQQEHRGHQYYGVAEYVVVILRPSDVDSVVNVIYYGETKSHMNDHAVTLIASR